MASRISGELVQLSSPMVSWQPRMLIEHETAYMQDGTLLADRANCSVDMGAFPFFSSEVYHNVLAGLVPTYPLKAAEVCIITNRSSAPPSNFFGDLGFSMAQAGTESHFSQLAASIGMQPGVWKLGRISEIGPAGLPLCESVKQGADYDKLEKSAKEVIESSWYSRKYAANSQKHLIPVRMNPAINYSRGIGFACGESIMGFSQQFNASANYSITITMNENETLSVNTGIQADRTMTAIWKETIRKFIDIPDEDIIFVDINDPDILDLGPSALSRKIGIVSALLIKACSELARKLRFSRLPISVTAENEAELTDPFYYSSGIGAVAIDLHIDTVMLSPIIDNVWVNFHLSHVFDMDRLLNKARHTITAVLSDICPRSTAKCNIDIKIDQDGSFTASSLTAGLRGLTTAALVGALSQALGHTIHRIPVTSDDILGIAILQHQNSEGGEK
jgi:CO/xanthine dehydrogenase Mo-binding subunit